MSAPRHVRERRAAVGWALFATAIIAALLAVWLWSPQMLMTSGILLVAAAGAGMGSWT